MLGLQLRVGGCNGGNGHIKCFSNSPQHAGSATDSLLINVEQCSVCPCQSWAGTQHLFSAPVFFFFLLPPKKLQSNASLIVFSLFVFCLSLSEWIFQYLAELQLIRALQSSGNALCGSDGFSVCMDTELDDL